MPIRVTGADTGRRPSAARDGHFHFRGPFIAGLRRRKVDAAAASSGTDDIARRWYRAGFARWRSGVLKRARTLRRGWPPSPSRSSPRCRARLVAAAPPDICRGGAGGASGRRSSANGAAFAEPSGAGGARGDRRPVALERSAGVGTASRARPAESRAHRREWRSKVPLGVGPPTSAFQAWHAHVAEKRGRRRMAGGGGGVPSTFPGATSIFCGRRRCQAARAFSDAGCGAGGSQPGRAAVRLRGTVVVRPQHRPAMAPRRSSLPRPDWCAVSPRTPGAIGADVRQCPPRRGRDVTT